MDIKKKAQRKAEAAKPVVVNVVKAGAATASDSFHELAGRLQTEATTPAGRAMANAALGALAAMRQATGEPEPDIALTADHVELLRYMATLAICRPVTWIVDNGAIRDRSTVTRLLSELEEGGLVHWPHGNRKGCILTERGRKRCAQLPQ